MWGRGLGEETQMLDGLGLDLHPAVGCWDLFQLLKPEPCSPPILSPQLGSWLPRFVGW